MSRVLTGNAGVRSDKYEAVQALISKYNFRPNALARGLSETRRKVIGINDAAAVGAMNCIQEHGLRIPEDISVVGYDNTPVCNMMTRS